VIGAEVALQSSLPDSLSTASVLFSESPSRIIVSFPASSSAAIENLVAREKCPFTVIGHVGGSTLRIRLGKEVSISAEVSALENVWRRSLSTKLEAEVMAAGRE
jgi:phosphoribosylformylglycinamidine synthase